MTEGPEAGYGHNWEALQSQDPGLNFFSLFSGDKDERASKAEEHSRTVVSLKLQLRQAIENIIDTSPTRSL